jgi:DNA-binding transcriptional MocR family regulator
MARSALWREIAETLEVEIARGHAAAGARLPTEAELAARFGVNRHTVRHALADLAAHYEQAGPPRGEITLVIGPPADVEPDSAAIDAALKAALPFMPVKAATDMIAALTDGSRKQIYARALEIKDDGA